MRILAIEPTPNPNSMKLTLDESLPDGISLSYGRGGAAAAPPYLQSLLQIDGVKSVFHVSDFIAVERYPQADWQRILAQLQRAIATAPSVTAVAEPSGKVNVFIQLLRGLPMQIKLVTAEQEVRVRLPERFNAAAMAVAASSDLLAERRWVSRGVRYGELDEIGREVAAEVDAAYDDLRLSALRERALRQVSEEAAPSDPLTPEVVAERLRSPDWRERYGALEQMEPVPGSLTVLLQALADPNPSVRRLATVYLGEIGDGVIPHLVRMLRDPSPAVRRAAGDCLSDLGDPAAIGPMAEALQDSSKLVRWRAARYLYEVGDRSALPALRAAQDDAEFEVRLQIKMAIERISGGHGVVEPAWKKMLQ